MPADSKFELHRRISKDSSCEDLCILQIAWMGGDIH